MQRIVLSALLVILVAGVLPDIGRAEDFAHPGFRDWWAATDAPVAQGAVYRAWVWGPEPRGGGRQEPYAEAPGGTRLVQYFDKGRMELTTPDGPLTSGLLASQMLTGVVQTGDDRFAPRPAPEMSIVGDPDDIIAPTYATFGWLLARPPQEAGTPIVQVANRDGSIGADQLYARYDVRADMLIPETGHRLANVFRAYFEGSPLPGLAEVQAAPFAPWYAVTGLPISEPYWTQARVGTIVRDVLVQAFERRILTYTPSNPQGFKVEMGNIGLHYLRWLENAAPRPPTAPELPCPAVVPPADGSTERRLVLLESGWHDVGGRRFVTGTIRNDSSTTSAAEVSVERVDSRGRVVQRYSAFTDRDIWPQGKLAAFRINLPPGESFDNWRIDIDRGDRPSGGLAGGFTIEQLGGRVGGLGVGEVSGRLRYTGAEPFTNLVIVRIHALDACGNVVAAGFAPLVNRAIAPGSTTDFSTILLDTEGAVQLRAVVEARIGESARIADDALRVYHGALYPAPVLPIVAVDGCCQYTRAYTRPDGTPVTGIYTLIQAEPAEE